MRWSYVRHGISADNSTSNRYLYVKKSTFTGGSEASYGHNKHINATWRAQDAVKREHESFNRGDDFF